MILDVLQMGVPLKVLGGSVTEVLGASKGPNRLCCPRHTHTAF